jgi:hypothetical protein
MEFQDDKPGRDGALRLGAVIVAPIVLVAALAAALTAFLNYGKFAATLAEVENARFALIARGVKSSLEANLNLGLTLSGLSNAQAILEQERAVVGEARAVVVFAADGAVLFTAGEAAGLRRAPAEWLAKADWTAESGTWRVVGTPLFDALGVMVGGVGVIYPSEPRDRILTEMAGRLTAAALSAAAATGLAAVLCMPFLLGRLRGITAAHVLPSLGASPLAEIAAEPQPTAVPAGGKEPA